MTDVTVRVGSVLRGHDVTLLVDSIVNECEYHVTALTQPFVYASDELGDRYRIRLDRIHTDDKPRRSGWSLVTP